MSVEVTQRAVCPSGRWMPSISPWMSSSRSSRLDEQVDYQGLAGARRHGSPRSVGCDFRERTPDRQPHAANRGVPYLLSARVSWPIVSIPDMGDGVSRRGADPSAQLRAARAGWPAARRMTVGHPRVVAGRARHQGGVGGGPTRERKSGVWKNLPC